jgi:ClpP class serine protease
MKRRPDMAPQRYDRTGLLAVDPKAFFELFVVPSSRANEMIDEVCVVDVCGPLDQHDMGWSDSYEQIKGRMAEACAGPAKAIVMRVDSPGGACAGCFDTVREIRAMCAEARKPLYAYCDHATSAGYALASAAAFIMIADTGVVGSIGVLERRPDFTAQNALHGVRIDFVTSGEKKAYGNPDLAITDAELTAKQEIVNAIAGVFFALVEEMRGIPAAELAAMQAGVFHAEASRSAGLTDDVGSFDVLVARVASGKVFAMASPYEKARSALEEAAKGDDANAAVAKRALATMAAGIGGDDDDKPDAEGDDADKPDAEGDDDADKPDAEGDDAPADDDKPKPPKTDPPAAATASSTGRPSASDTHSVAIAALAKAHTLEAQLATRDARAERKRLLARRDDFGKELRAELMKESTPIATVRNMVKTLPRVPVPGAIAGAADLAARAGGTGAATRGAGQGTTDTTGSDPRAGHASEMDQRMGLTEQTLGVTRTRNFLQFGVVHKPIEAVAAGKEATK